MLILCEVQHGKCNQPGIFDAGQNPDEPEKIRLGHPLFGKKRRGQRRAGHVQLCEGHQQRPCAAQTKGAADALQNADERLQNLSAADTKVPLRV